MYAPFGVKRKSPTPLPSRTRPVNTIWPASRDFTKLVLIALVLAIPAAWYLMDSWLNGFAYRIPIGVDSFLIAGGVSLAIAWLTVSYQSIKAALINPVNSLRRE